MKISLNLQEKKLLLEYAERFRQKTGENYSIFHIMSILTQKYEDNLDKDLREAMDIKERELQESLKLNEVNIK